MISVGLGEKNLGRISPTPDPPADYNDSNRWLISMMAEQGLGAFRGKTVSHSFFKVSVIITDA